MKIATVFSTFNPLFRPLPDTFSHTPPTHLPPLSSSPTYSTPAFSPTSHLYPTLTYTSESHYLRFCFVPLLTRLCTRATLLAILFLFFGLHFWVMHTIQCSHDTWPSWHSLVPLCHSRNRVLRILFLFFSLISYHITWFQKGAIRVCPIYKQYHLAS